MLVLGLDISTSISGATVLDSAGAMLYNESWDTRNKKYFPSIYHKARQIRDKLQDIKHQYYIENVLIEQSLHSFRSGFSSAQTLSTLSRLNGIVSWMCCDIFGIEPHLIAATTARKQSGLTIRRGENSKEKVLKFVIDNEPSFLIEYTKHGNPRPGTYDRADSYVIAKAGLNWKNSTS